MNELWKQSKTIYQWFLDACFPAKCLICHREGSYLCVEHDTFEPAPPNQAQFQYLDEIHAAVKYYHPAAETVVEYFKFKGFRDIAQIMAREIIREKPHVENQIIVPIPLHWTRKLWRGFNQAQVLAEALQKQNPNLKICHSLQRKIKTEQQARLGKNERLLNLQNAFVWKGESVPEKVILIDDVVASGSTLDAAAATLKSSGVSKVEAWVFARGGK